MRLASCVAALLCLLFCLPAQANTRLFGYCQQGNRTITTAGVSSSPTTPVMRSYPSCTVTVYLSGTLTLATLYANDNTPSPTPKSNPFVADTNGYYFFYATDGKYDVQLSGAGISPTFSLGDVRANDPYFLPNATNAISRTVKSKLNERLSVKDFGAVGNGATDDTAAIQNGVSAVCAGGGGELYIPQGVYLITSTVTVPAFCQGLHLYGSGPSETDTYGSTLKWTGAANGTVLKVYSVSWSTFELFRINGNSLAGIGLHNTADTVSPVVKSNQRNIFRFIELQNITGSPGYGMAFAGNAVFSTPDDISQNQITMCTFTNLVVGYYQNGIQTVHNVLEMNTFSNYSLYGAEYERGDVGLFKNVFIPPVSSATTEADVYVSNLVVFAHIQDNYHENQAGLTNASPGFSTWRFITGTPARIWDTYILGDRVLWSLPHGKILDYNQSGNLSLIGTTVDTNFLQSSGYFYVNNTFALSTNLFITGSHWFNPDIVLAFSGDTRVRALGGEPVWSSLAEHTDGSINTGSDLLDSASGGFTASMVGYRCYVRNYGSAIAAVESTILAVNSPSQVQLSITAANTASGLYYRCGRVRSIGASILSTSVPGSYGSVIMSDGQPPVFQMRTDGQAANARNWTWSSIGTVAYFSALSGDDYATSTASPYMAFGRSGPTATETQILTPVRLGSGTYGKMSYTYADVAGNLPGPIASGSGVSFNMAVAVATIGDTCLPDMGNSFYTGIIVGCQVTAAGQVTVSIYNFGGVALNFGSLTMRVSLFKNL